MTSEPPRTVFFLSDFGTRGRVRRRGPRGDRGAGPGDDGHRPDPSHPALRRAGGEPHLAAGGAAPRARRGAGRRRPRRRHRASGHRPRGRAAPRRDACPSSGPTTGCSWPRPKRRARRRSPGWWSWRGEPAPPDRGATFDGRDVFAPAAAALCTGAALEKLGEPIDPASLVRLVGGVVEEGRLHDGRVCLRAEVTWVDHFGNLQLAATMADARVAGIPLTGASSWRPASSRVARTRDGLPHSLVPDGVQLRCVDAFGELRAGGVRPARRRQRASGRGGRRGVGGALAQRRRRGAARPGLVTLAAPAVWCRREPPRYHPTQ